jgi:putative copper export protein/mono/diheme cytochrome c family protein
VSSGGSATSGIQALDSALRWTLWMGLLGIVGGAAFAFGILLPAAKTLTGDERRQARSFALRLAATVVGTSAVIVLVTNVVILLRQAALNGAIADTGQLLTGTTGAYWIVREALAVVAGMLALVLAWRARRPEGPLVVALPALALVAGLGGLATMSLTSHAAAGTGTAWAVSSDFLHLTGVGLWLGCLVQLPLLLASRRGPTGSARAVFAGRALHRFSAMAVCAVALVLLTGTFNALVQVPSWSALVDTAYGRTVLIKVALIAPLLGLGFWNATRVARRFEQRALAGDAGVAYRPLLRNAVLESGAGAIVIAATAILVFLVPAKDAAVQAAVQKASAKSATISSVYRNQAPAGDLTATLTVAPNRVGLNDFKVQLVGPSIDKVQRVQLRFQYSAQQVGQSAVVANPVPGSAGTYDLQAANFSLVGVWGVTINVLRTGSDDANGSFSVEVPDVTGATTAATLQPTQRSVTAFPAHGIAAAQVWGALVAAGGVLLFVFRSHLPGRRHLPGGTGAALAGAAVLAGVAVIGVGRTGPQPAAAVAQNPVPADQQSVAAGKALYAATCAKCHGATGHGDGPLAAALNPRPFDLTVHVGLHPDAQLFDWITNGIPRTAMPAWRAQLSDTQRWDLLNYLRTLSPGDTTGATAPAASPAPTVTASPAGGR